MPQQVRNDEVAIAGFSREALIELRERLGNGSDAIVHELAEILIRFPGTKAALTAHRRQFLRAWRMEIKSMRSVQLVLSKLKHKLDGFSDKTKRGVAGNAGEGVNLANWLEDLAKIERGVATYRANCVRMSKELPFAVKRGRARNEARHWLANGVAGVLRRHGVPVKTTRGGTFEFVLIRVIEAAEGKTPPVEIYQTVRKTVDLLNHMGDLLLDHLPPELLGLARRPTNLPDCESGNVMKGYVCFALPIRAMRTTDGAEVDLLGYGDLVDPEEPVL